MRITGKTKIYVLFGHPVQHSLSPVMQNAAFQALGLDCLYIPWSVPPRAFPDTLKALRDMENFGGGNVTIPHKEQAAALVDDLSPEAALLNAVNTLVKEEGHLVGHNTDGAGFLQSLREDAGFDPKGKRVLLLGAGGAAKAIAFALAEVGVGGLFISNRTWQRAETLAQLVGGKYPGCQILALGLQKEPLVPVLASIDLLVNATSVGLHASDPSLIDCGALNPQAVVVDLIYNPEETTLLREAKARGLKAVNGLGMLLHQGALAFERWTKQKAPLAVMRGALFSRFP